MRQNSRNWTVCYTLSLIGLTLFWASESFLIQASAFDGAPSNLHPVTYQIIRFTLNLMTTGFILFVASRGWLIALAAADFLLSCAIIPYNHYFHHSLDVEMVRTADEGFHVVGFAFKEVASWIWIALICALALKITWIYLVTPQPSFLRRRLAAACFGVEAMALVALQFTSFNIAHFRQESDNRAAYAYGYLNSWIGESLWGPDMSQVAADLRKMQENSPDRLSATEGKWPLGSHIAVVQLESVGWDVLNLKINGHEVTPYLNRLARLSRVFRIQAYHNVGSADMDYAVLSGGTPSPWVISYEVPGLTYVNDLPHFMKKHGFHTVAFHGNSGSFFNRRPNYARMGFDELCFKEDFAGRLGNTSSWGVRDGDIFQLSSEKMRQARGPEFHFLITLDTHAPFDLIDDSEKEIFPHSAVWQENYFNSLRVLDHKLRDYVESLPNGTVVIFYGDHTAGVTYGDYHSDREGPAEFVPCIVYVCHGSDTWVAEADPPGELPKDLRVHDVINVLRHQLQNELAADSSK